ncbi:hypothetical protein BDF22DRAFT_744831 [Syncephalis plumigaleata]|nr:hypothetical protein BDF22DRAFT_744831 [Syncephalis plumigaleata]
MSNDRASDYAQESTEPTDATQSPGAPSQPRPLDPLIVSMFVTSGTIPPPVAGASLTVIGDRLWVFGGRLVSNRRMTNELYSLHMETFVWRRHINLPGDPPPEPRYFHSADQYTSTRLVIFGGMGQRLGSEATSTSNTSNGHDSSVVLADVTVLDVSDPNHPRWRRPRISGPMPRARYAHLTAVNGRQLVVIGGQDLQNTYVEDVHTLDLDTFTWTQASPFPKHCGVYRSIALCYSGSTYVYSNYNFTDVRRELQVLGPDLHLTDRSRGMTGENRPPGLRFPTGHLIGDHLVVSGTYLTNTSQTFSTWLLDMRRLVWARLECSRPLHKGSWNRAVLDARRNRHLILGNRDRTLLVDYEHRRVNFEHVAAVCLESYGVYDVPRQRISVLGQELGGTLLNRRQFSDFEIRAPADNSDASDDEDDEYDARREGANTNGVQQQQANGPGRSISSEQNNSTDSRRGSMNATTSIGSKANAANDTNERRGLDDTPLQRGDRAIFVNTRLLRQRWPHFDRLMRANTQENKHRFLRLPESFSVIRHLLHYLYTGALDPSSSVDVLGELMVLGDVYDLMEMQAQAAHVLHGRLTLDTAPHIFRYATIARRNGLRVRALRIMRRNHDVLARSVAFWQLPDAIRSEVMTFLPANFTRTPPASVAAVLASSQTTTTATGRQNTLRGSGPSSTIANTPTTTATTTTTTGTTNTTTNTNTGIANTNTTATDTIVEDNEPDFNGNSSTSFTNHTNNNTNLSTATRNINGWSSSNDPISTNGYIVNGVHTLPSTERSMHSTHASISSNASTAYGVDPSPRHWMHRPSAVGLSAIEGQAFASSASSLHEGSRSMSFNHQHPQQQHPHPHPHPHHPHHQHHNSTYTVSTSSSSSFPSHHSIRSPQQQSQQQQQQSSIDGTTTTTGPIYTRQHVRAASTSTAMMHR